jgi:transposase InsO family protein
VLTDNAWPCRKSWARRDALAELDQSGRLPRAYRPQTDDKVERFNRTGMRTTPSRNCQMSRKISICAPIEFSRSARSS